MSTSTRRKTIGAPLTTSSSSSASSANIERGRQSLGGKFAPISKSNSRASLAPSNTARPSIGGSRQSLAPQTSRPSIGGIGGGGRNSLGSRNALVDRKSGGRRSSGAAARGVRSDPRPITSKEFVRDNIRKLILYLTSHHYDHQLSPKQLASPSVKDFKNIILFLFQKLDVNFQFPADFEDSVKTYMKRFGYPFAISKAALQAAGSPHTWPSLLAMLVWMQEFLQYHDTVHGSAVPLGTESDSKMFFEYASGAYLAFLQGEDNFTLFDETLAKKFEYKNQVVSEDIRRFQGRSLECQQSIQEFQAALQRLEEYTSFVKACKSDIPVLEENIQHNQQHMQMVLTKKAARATELETRTAVLQACKEEQASLNAQLAAQPFTPLQVQEMLHQKSTLEASLEAQRVQAEQIQSETWKAEMESSRALASIEKLLAEMNEISMEVAANSSKSSAPFIHQEWKLSPSAAASFAAGPAASLELLKADSLLTIDLAQNKIEASAARDALLQTKKESLLESKRRTEALAVLAETQSERRLALDSLSKRLRKLSDMYSSERAACNRAVEASCAEVEDVELEIVRLRNALSAGTDKVPQAALAAMDADMRRAEQQFLAEEAALKADICLTMQELTEHKVGVTERIEEILLRAEQIKQNISKTEVKKSEQ